MEMDEFFSNALNPLSSKAKNLGQADLGSVLKEEVKEAISPFMDKVNKLEKKLDLLIMTAERIEKLLITLQPLSKLIGKLPFLS